MTSEKGWTSDHLCMEWFKKRFVPMAEARRISNRPILLIFDGHHSHITSEMVLLAKEQDIELYCLPPKTTHKLQPLDVGIFGPLQHVWQKELEKYLAMTGFELPRADIVSVYMRAREQAFTAGIILKAWKKSGIRPLNSKIFTDKDYAPSALASKELHLPEEFLTEPSSDMPIPDDALSEHGADLSDHENLGNANVSWHNTETTLVADQSADTEVEEDIDAAMDAGSELAESDDGGADPEGDTGDDDDVRDDDDTHYLITGDMGTDAQVSSASEAMLSTHASPTSTAPQADAQSQDVTGDEITQPNR